MNSNIDKKRKKKNVKIEKKEQTEIQSQNNKK
jgi:hypothetical protein